MATIVPEIRSRTASKTRATPTSLITTHNECHLHFCSRGWTPVMRPQSGNADVALKEFVLTREYFIKPWSLLEPRLYNSIECLWRKWEFCRWVCVWERLLTSQSYSEATGITRPSASSNLIGLCAHVWLRSAGGREWTIRERLHIISLWAFLVHVNISSLSNNAFLPSIACHRK